MSSRAAAVWVIGGANVDFKARSAGSFLAGTSNPGRVHRAFGGVARNVAENLGRLGWRPKLVSAVGADEDGETLLANAFAAGVDVRHTVRVRGTSTGRYVALLSGDGELIGAVADMSAVEGLELARIPHADMRAGDVAMIDANLSTAACAPLLAACREAGVTTFVEPVSAEKSRRLAASLPYIDVITPNGDELAALLEDVRGIRLVGPAGWSEMAPAVAREVIADGAAMLCQAGCGATLVTCGALGACLVEGNAEPLWFPAQKRAVLDVTGAGDALMAGVLHGCLLGEVLALAMPYGMALAALTVGTAGAVVDTLTRESLEAERLTYIAGREWFEG